MTLGGGRLPKTTTGSISGKGRIRGFRAEIIEDKLERWRAIPKGESASIVRTSDMENAFRRAQLVFADTMVVAVVLSAHDAHI